MYDVSSEFDYKLNFNNLEYFDWYGNWYPLGRMTVRVWRSEYAVEAPLLFSALFSGRGISAFFARFPAAKAAGTATAPTPFERAGAVAVNPF